MWKMKIETKTTEEISKELSFDKRTVEEIDDFLLKKWVGVDELILAYTKAWNEGNPLSPNELRGMIEIECKEKQDKSCS